VVWSLGLGLGLVVGCGGDERSAPASTEEEPREESSTTAAPAAGEAEPQTPEAPAEPPAPPKRIFAKRFVVPVRSGPSRGADRIGYLRAGAVLMATHAEPVPDEPVRRRCRGGWYELTTGGFVCNGRDVIAFEGDELPALRARQPNRTDPLPYPYGFIRHRVPLFRRLPTREELAELRAAAQPAPEETSSASAMSAPTDAPGSSSSAMAAAGMAAAGMAAAGMEPSTATGTTMAAPSPSSMASEGASATAMAPANDPEPAAAESGTNLETAEEDAGITLAALEGPEDSIILRTLMRGFFVSLDREFERDGRRYWRTQANGFVPANAVLLRTGSEFAGVQLTGEAAEAAPSALQPPSGDRAEASAPNEERAGQLEAPAVEAAGDEAPEWTPPAPRLPYAWVLSSRSRAYQRTERGRFRRLRSDVAYHEGFVVLEEVEEGGRRYLRAGPNRWFRERDVRVARRRERRPRHRRMGEVGPDDQWIDIDLSQQTLVAYEGDRPVFATLISSGKKVAGEDWETLTGLFRIKSKHLTDTMDGDTAVDGPYSVDDVPYVMYIELAYALHSAFWHNGFGRPRSHGCVNLSPRDAQWVFNWSRPRLPENWHSVYPTEDEPGTWVFIHGETPLR